ncbi:MAG: carbohydrate-binding protein [Clostridia bacterium]|nr:carbohydrate-binding protein [Clostridia bacterium]
MKKILRLFIVCSLLLSVISANCHISVNGAEELLVCTQTSEELAISNSVLIDINASCIVVSGARRYINYNNPKETPELIDGSLYLPARTLSLALGCYYENLPDKTYILFRNDELGKELYFSSQGSYQQSEMGSKLPIDFRGIYKNGDVYLPVRGVAELLGKTVNYKDGIVIIDDKASADALMENNLFTYVKSLFDGFEPEQGQGRVYHVAQTDAAKDYNPGTEAKPFKTLAKACAVATAGDTVIIHKGVYREELAPKESGTPTNPIVFKAANDGSVVISATEVVDSFTQEGSFAVASIPKNLGTGKNQVFYNGEGIAEGRYPDNASQGDMADVDEALPSLFPITGDLRVSAENSSKVVSDTLLKETETDYWKDAIFVSVHGKAYTVSTARVASSVEGELTLTDTSHNYWHSVSESDVWNYGYLTCHINAVNEPGEWTVKDNKLYIIPPEGETAASLSVEMKARQATINLSGKKFIQVVGINSFGGSAILKDSEMCVINDVDMKYISHYTYSDDQRNGYIDDASVRTEDSAPQKGEVGVYISGRDNAVIHSSFDTGAAAGLYLAGLYSYIDDNIISNCGYMGSYVSGITVYNEPWEDKLIAKGGCSVYNNTVYNSGRYLFMIQGMSEGTPFLPIEVAYNDFHDGGLYSTDVGNIYAYGINAATSKRVSKVHNNYVYSTASKSNPMGFGIYCDGGSNGIDCYNNLIFTTKQGTIFTHGYAYKNKNQSTCTLNSNAQLKGNISGGVAALTAENFPKNKPFYAGALQNMTDYTANYTKDDEKVYYLSATEGTKSGSITNTDDGGIVFGNTSAELTFNDVEITGTRNNLRFYFGGDKSKTDILSVTVQDSANTDIYELPLNTKAKDLYKMDMADLALDVDKGVYDVKLKVTTTRGTPHLYGMSVTSDGKNINAGRDGANVLAVDYSHIYKIGSMADLFISPTYEKNGYSYLINTYSGSTVLYKNVVVENDVNTLNIAVAQKTEHNPISMEFRIGSPDAEPIATYTVEQSTWDDRTVRQVALESTLPQGTYNIYVKFTSQSSATTNFHSFGFSQN